MKVNPIFENLNPAQKQAVMAKNGPILVAAGAGSGKTKVLTHRIIYLISQGVKPEKILAITFTNKASAEMKKRIDFLLGENQSFNSPRISTFHSLGAFILRKNARNAGLKSNFSILDENDSAALLKKAEKNLGLDTKQFPVNRIQNIIGKEKGRLVSLEDYKKQTMGEFFPETLSKIWEEYERLLNLQNSVDYDDLILKPALLFRKRPGILETFQQMWAHLLIDEYQDTNHGQYILSKYLVQKHQNIFAVGDTDQSIYNWRGADFRNVFAFQKDFKNAQIFILEENYRSAPAILEAANALISCNKERLPKNLFTKKTETDVLGLFPASSEEEEVLFVVSKIKELLKQNAKPSEIAVLFRANFLSRLLEEKFLAWKIPHQVIGTRFYERKEIKDILSYLRVSLNSSDAISLNRIINVPARGIGDVLRLKYLSGKKELSVPEKQKIGEFESLLGQIKDELNSQPISKTISFILKKTKYLDLFDQSQEEDLKKIANLKELIGLSKTLDGYPPPEGALRLLEQASLMSEQDAIKNENSVKLITVHSAKGLEFDYVFIIGLEEGLFPHILSQIQKDESGLEEERRLFYVALTRARKKVFLSYAVFRKIMGEKKINLPSRFINEIPFHLIERIC